MFEKLQLSPYQWIYTQLLAIKIFLCERYAIFAIKVGIADRYVRLFAWLLVELNSKRYDWGNSEKSDEN